mmetsp:Transcript_61723/g.121208  ORF Transcript_61723/g.121208 Transcript_61723/m.121208 type:complete len:315 (-) Transcript_61723:751-1695(-)
MCRSPKNPHFRPLPSAADSSGWTVTDASFKQSLPTLFFSSSKSPLSVGYREANSMGREGMKPGRGGGSSSWAGEESPELALALAVFLCKAWDCSAFNFSAVLLRQSSIKRRDDDDREVGVEEEVAVVPSSVLANSPLGRDGGWWCFCLDGGQWVMVSPSSACRVDRMPAIMYPTCPEKSALLLRGWGPKNPSSWTVNASEPCSRQVVTLSPSRSAPSTTSIRQTTPLKSSNQESTTLALHGAYACPVGGGRRSTMAGRSDATPAPVLADVFTQSSGSSPKVTQSCSRTSSGFALGRSILVTTGITLRPCCVARS